MGHKQQIKNGFLFSVLLLLFTLAFARVHMRVQFTLTGYEIGELKKQEHKLLKRRSDLQMQLSKLTSRRHLEHLAAVKPGMKPKQRKLVSN